MDRDATLRRRCQCIADLFSDAVELENVGFDVDRLPGTLDRSEQARKVLLAIFQQFDSIAAVDERPRTGRQFSERALRTPRTGQRLAQRLVVHADTNADAPFAPRALASRRSELSFGRPCGEFMPLPYPQSAACDRSAVPIQLPSGHAHR